MKKTVLISLFLILSLGISGVYATEITNESEIITIYDSERNQSEDDIANTESTSAAPNPYGIVVKELRNSADCSETRLPLGHISEYEYWMLSGTSIYRHGCNKGQAFCKVVFEDNTWQLVARSTTHECGSGCGATSVICHAMGKVKMPVATK